MSFMPTDAPEFEEVRQRHDAWMERSRRELMTDVEDGEGGRVLALIPAIPDDDAAQSAGTPV